MITSTKDHTLVSLLMPLELQMIVKSATLRLIVVEGLHRLTLEDSEPMLVMVLLRQPHPV